jgi:putative nucleotidyltransferase with HDIG domain
MAVHVIADTSARLAGVRAVLERKHVVTSELLRGLGVQRSNVDALVVKADLRTIENICALKKVLAAMKRVEKRVFLVEDSAHLSIAQAYALGATAVISRAKEAMPKIAQIEYAEAAAESAASDPALDMDAGVAAFATMFSNVRHGRPLQVADAQRATTQIVKRVGQGGLSTWLDEVRRYHEGTFQHCLLVTGVAVAFALDVGFSSTDVSRLGMAATLHDIGKARIPLSILDKPGRLDPDEEEIIRRHPVIGHDLLKGMSGITPEILDGVRHHHEYLDGSGYPDKLAAAGISDLVRVLTISDIFAALLEHRSYKPTMPREKAYDILLGMHGKLEKPLVEAFREVALNR